MRKPERSLRRKRVWEIISKALEKSMKATGRTVFSVKANWIRRSNKWIQSYVERVGRKPCWKKQRRGAICFRRRGLTIRSNIRQRTEVREIGRCEEATVRLLVGFGLKRQMTFASRQEEGTKWEDQIKLKRRERQRGKREGGVEVRIDWCCCGGTDKGRVTECTQEENCRPKPLPNGTTWR